MFFKNIKKNKRKNSPKILKNKQNMNNKIKTIINELTKSSSNDDIFSFKVINLIKCKK